MKVKEETRKKRRKNTGEVFTPTSVVIDMLKNIPEEVRKDPEKTFLDNSCGNGNFLAAILEMKLNYGHNPDKALNTIFGVDLMEDNVLECRLRLLNILKQYTTPTKKHLLLLCKNIVCHDALTYDYEFKIKDKVQLKNDIKVLELVD